MLSLALGAAILLPQLYIMFATHLTDCCGSRYFSWAPNDYSVNFRVTAYVNGRMLNDAEFRERYRIRKEGYYQNPPERLKEYLQRRELAYGRDDRVGLTVHYQLNGHAPVDWSWSNG